MKDTFFKSTLILLIGGAITKILGLIIKIISTRIIGLEGISLYMLIFPTFSLFMTVSQMGLSTALSKLVAENKRNNKNLVLSIIPITILFNIILIVLIFLTAPIISYFLKDERTLIPIISIAFVLPFDCISSILRGYFFGKEKMFPHIFSLIIEQITRLILIIIFIPNLLNKSVITAVSGLVLVNIISETISTITLILFIKDRKIKLKDFIPNKSNIKSILNISIPTTTSRVIGSIAYFFEPIIITTSLLLMNYNKTYIIQEYGIIEGYVLPLLLIPSFFTNALSSALIPDISKKYIEKNYRGIIKRINKVIKISLSIGIISSLILFINPNIFLKLLYKTNHGTYYLRALAPFFIFLYIQIPLESVLQAINKSKKVMINNILGTIIKLLLIFILSFLKIGLFNLIIAIIANILITTVLHVKAIKKELIFISSS